MFINKFPFVIAEIGLNHNGDVDIAKELIDVAKEAGCSAVKFQLRSPRTFRKVQGYRDIGSEIVDEYIEETFLDFSAYEKLYNYAINLNIPCIFSSWDLESVEFAISLNPPAFKIASADLNNTLLIEKLIKTGKHLILSTGMSTEQDIEQAINYLNSKDVDYTLLHCHSAYPAPPHHLNLGYITNLQSKCLNPVGYSSHDIGNTASLIALAFGARIFEKHITLDKSGYGNDNTVSLEPIELKDYVQQLNTGIKMLSGSSSNRAVGPGEKFNRISLSKSIITLKNLKKGDCIDLDNIEFYPSGEGLSPNEVEKLHKIPLQKDVKSGEIISKHHFESASRKIELNLLQKYQAGLPVRYRDMDALYNKFKLNFHEIHLSYNDLEFKDFASIPLIKNKGSIGFHAPDIYEKNLIFDPTSFEPGIAEQSIKSYDRVLRHVSCAIEAINIPTPVILTTSFSCFSELNHNKNRKEEYSKIFQFIDKCHSEYPLIQILPQTLPALAWYLGGQRYVNTFANPEEIYAFCSQYQAKICMDISHLIMSCNYYGLDVEHWFEKLLPFSRHFHLAGASGIDDEGLSIQESDSAVKLVNKLFNHKVLEDVSFMTEAWQGHLNNGEGFEKDLVFLNKLLLQ